MFIVFEGIDGSGKTTQWQRLCDALERDGVPVEKHREQTDGAIGRLIRQSLTFERVFTKETLALLFAADRREHIEDMRRDLDANRVVVCDRYLFSSLAYQSLDLPMERVIEYNRQNAALLLPDVVIYIDTPVEVCLERIVRRREASELFETREQLVKIAQNYDKAFVLFDGLRVVRIDGSGNEDEVAARVRVAVNTIT